MEAKHFRNARPSHGPSHNKPFSGGGPKRTAGFGASGASRFRKPGGHGGPSRFGGSRGGNRGGRGGGFSQFIDTSKFVKKAVITEETVAYVPEHQFSAFLIDERLKKNIAFQGYTTPTPIQDKAIPHILRGSDVVGIANTGTGKTAAFLIPLINKMLVSPKEKTLVMVPTRELAIQIETEFKKFVQHLNMYAVCCVGGAPIGPQLGQLRRHFNIVIGTPGRLRDLIERKALRLNEYGAIVLDEADRMLDMGFIADVRFIVSQMPVKRHTLFFSATMSREIETLISEFLNQPVKISVRTQESSDHVDQDIVRVPNGKNKFDVLRELLSQPGFDKVLVFGKTKHGVQRLAQMLVSHGFSAESIHGNKTHGQRQKALKLFKDSGVKVLVATDVAARGLDIAGVSHVINYDLPATYADYVHRIGRTGRANKMGKALTFV